MWPPLQKERTAGTAHRPFGILQSRGLYEPIFLGAEVCFRPAFWVETFLVSLLASFLGFGLSSALAFLAGSLASFFGFGVLGALTLGAWDSFTGSAASASDRSTSSSTAI